MNVSTKLCVPDDATASVTITGTIKELKEIIESLERTTHGERYPLYQIKTAAWQVINSASKTWQQTVE